MITVLRKTLDSLETDNTIQVVVNKGGGPDSNVLGQILSKESTDISFSIIKKERLYNGEKFFIRFASSKVGLDYLLDRIASIGNPLDHFASVNTGIMGGCDLITKRNIQYISEETVADNDIRLKDGVFVLNKENYRDLAVIDILASDVFLRPFFKNSDIKKYYTNTETEKRIIFSSRESPPSEQTVSKHLNRYKQILVRIREINNESVDDWLYLRRGTSHQQIFEGKKIVAPQRSQSNSFGYNEVPWYASADVYLITEKLGVEYSLKALLGILNSKLIYLWLYHRGKRKGEVLELYRTPLAQIPIIEATATQQKEIVGIVDEILKNKETNPDACTSALESQVDQLVYQLYGLSSDEIAIVESSTK